MDIFFILFTTLLVGLTFIVSLFYTRLRFAMRKGKFTFTKNNAEFLSFNSDFGNFHFRFKEQTLFANLTNNKKTVPLQELAGIRYSVDDESALHFEKFGAKGADFNDLIHWYTIKLVLKDRTEIPLLIAGEFERVDWFWRWQTRLEINYFHRLNLVADVNTHCRKVLDTLLNSFKNAGHELPLI
jgi:hypothetical protein